VIGAQIGPYRIASELGSGGMGTVYLAEDEQGGNVAVKVVHPHLLATPGFFKRFLREAELGRQVRHENVVRTLDVDALMVDDRQVNFMVMEYVVGKSLRDLLIELKTLPEALLREVARQAAAGLAAIHAEEIVHRDLKPENVLITDDQTIRLMDLGVAKLQEASIAITKEGQFAGSILYAAPEQFRDAPVGPASDLYSLGVMFYELATGDNPFRRDDAAGVIQAHLNLEPPPASDRNPSLSPFLAEVIATLLAKGPADRLASAQALHRLLEEAERSDWWAERESQLRRRTAHLPRVIVQRETELHARDDELAALREGWAQAVEGRGGTVILEGEAGIGKTRLLDEFIRSFEGKDVHALYGAYPPSGGMGGLSDAIIGKFGSSGLDDALRPYLTVTPSLVPTFAALVKHESPPTGAEPLGGDALHAVVCHLMRALAEEKPTLWIIEDLQFAPIESRHLLLSMARAIGSHRLLLVGTNRSSLPDDELAHFSRLENFRRVPLRRLGARDVIELVKDTFKSEILAEKLGGRIAHKSDGVPFFIFEMIRGLKEGRFIQQQADGTYVQTQLITDIEVPSAVKDLIEGRMRGLSENQRAILDAGAVQGLSFDPSLVAAVLEEKKVKVLRELAEIERRFGLVRDEADSVRFDQNQIQEVLYRDLTSHLRTEYHSLLAEAHAERCGEDPRGRDAHFLASHHLRGSRPQLALPHLEAALDHLKNTDRNEAHLQLTELALADPGLLAGAPRAEILLWRAARLGRLGRPEEQRTALDEALALADAAAEPGLQARGRTALSQHLRSLADDAAAQAAAGEALRFAREAGDRVVEAKALIAHGHARRSREQEAARQDYEAGRLIAIEVGDRWLEGAGLGSVGLVLLILGRYEEGLDHHRRHAALAREDGNRRSEAIAIANAGNALLALGRLEEAHDHFARAILMHREAGSRTGETINLGNIGALLAQLGRPEEARDNLTRGLALAREIGRRYSEGYGLHRLGLLARQEGDLDRAARSFEQALELRREIDHRDGCSETLCRLGMVTAERGDVAAATAHFDEALAIARAQDSPTITLLAAAHRAVLPGGDISLPQQLLAEERPRFDSRDVIEARFVLWRATREPEHLEDAHALLMKMRDHAPADCRTSMIENVPLHRDIAAAWEAR
jgi:tetratricopeptide (TPR) repeat protein